MMFDDFPRNLLAAIKPILETESSFLTLDNSSLQNHKVHVVAFLELWITPHDLATEQRYVQKMSFERLCLR